MYAAYRGHKVVEQHLLIHGLVCSKGTGSSSWCKLALKTIVWQTIFYYYLRYGQRLLHSSILWGICSIRTATIALCTEQRSTLCYTMVFKASVHQLLEPVPFEQTSPWSRVAAQQLCTMICCIQKCTCLLCPLHVSSVYQSSFCACTSSNFYLNWCKLCIKFNFHLMSSHVRTLTDA